MPIERGKTFLLKRGDGAPTEAFTTVALMRSNGFSGARGSLGTTNKDSPNSWEERLPNLKSMTLSASGIWDGSAQQKLVRDDFLTGDSDPVNYQMVGDTETFEGPFIVTQFDNEGEHDGERTWSVTLESAGEVAVTDA